MSDNTNFTARAYVDDEEIETIDDVPFRNIVEFAYDQIAGEPFSTEKLADKVVVERSDDGE